MASYHSYNATGPICHVCWGMAVAPHEAPLPRTVCMVKATSLYASSRADHLSIQPQGGGAITIVKAVVRSKVLHIRLPGGRDGVGVQVHIILLVRDIALNVEDELLAR